MYFNDIILAGWLIGIILVLGSWFRFFPAWLGWCGFAFGTLLSLFSYTGLDESIAFSEPIYIKFAIIFIVWCLLELIVNIQLLRNGEWQQFMAMVGMQDDLDEFYKMLDENSEHETRLAITDSDRLHTLIIVFSAVIGITYLLGGIILGFALFDFRFAQGLFLIFCVALFAMHSYTIYLIIKNNYWNVNLNVLYYTLYSLVVWFAFIIYVYSIWF